MIDASGFGLGLLGMYYSLKARQAKRARAAPLSIHVQAMRWITSTGAINLGLVTGRLLHPNNKQKTGALLPDEDGRGPDVNLAVALQLSS